MSKSRQGKAIHYTSLRMPTELWDQMTAAGVRERGTVNKWILGLIRTELGSQANSYQLVTTRGQTRVVSATFVLPNDTVLENSPRSPK